MKCKKYKKHKYDKEGYCECGMHITEELNWEREKINLSFYDVLNEPIMNRLCEKIYNQEK